jgi:hypothetical protein
LARLREPNRPADWERFVAQYTPLLYAWTRSLRVPPEDAGDLPLVPSTMTASAWKSAPPVRNMAFLSRITG